MIGRLDNSRNPKRKVVFLMFLTFSFTNVRINLIKLIRNALLTFVIIMTLTTIVKYNLKIQQDYKQAKAENAQIQIFRNYMDLKNMNY